MNQFTRKSLIFFAALALPVSCKPLPQPPVERHYEMTAPPRSAGFSRVELPPVSQVIASPKAVQDTAKRTVKIGLLLPLSGDSAAMGKAMLDAATLALFDKYETATQVQLATNVVLLPEDTSAGAQAAAQKLIDAGAQVILGPLFAADVEKAAIATRAADIPLISFSNSRTVAGRGVYIFGFSPEDQVKRVAEFLVKNSYKRIALLAPSDPYGQTVSQELNASVSALGGKITDTQFYTPGSTNVDSVAMRLVSAQRDRPDDSFQALLIAEGGGALRKLADNLVKARLNRKAVRLVGTGKWDDSASMGVPSLVGGWFASTHPENVRKFERGFVKAYGEIPPRVASLAYDAVALTASLGMDGEHFSNASLLHEEGFVGPANGLFRFTPDGRTERGLAILEVGGRNFKLIDPAPSSF